MRIYLDNINIAKSAAKRLKNSLSNDFPLNKYQIVIANMLGYANWDELHKVTTSKHNKPSPFDEEISQEEQKIRLNYQKNRLAHIFDMEEQKAHAQVLFLRLTSGNKQSENLYLSNYSNNHFAYTYEDDGSVSIEVILSFRSNNKEDELLEMVCDGGGYESEDLEIWFELSKQQPEGIRCHAYLLETLIENNDFDRAKEPANNVLMMVRSLLKELPNNKIIHFDYAPYKHRYLIDAITCAKEIFEHHRLDLQVKELTTALVGLSELLARPSRIASVLR